MGIADATWPCPACHLVVALGFQHPNEAACLQDLEVAKRVAQTYWGNRNAPSSEEEPRLTAGENEFRKKIIRVRKRIESVSWLRALTAKEQHIGSQIDDALRSVDALRAYMAAQSNPQSTQEEP